MEMYVVGKRGDYYRKRGGGVRKAKLSSDVVGDIVIVRHIISYFINLIQLFLI